MFAFDVMNVALTWIEARLSPEFSHYLVEAVEFQ